jgi:WD40 repeat protein
MLLLEGNTGTVTAMTFAPDGHTLAVGTANGMVRLWNPSTDAASATYQTQTVQALAYSPDGQYLVSGCADHTLQLWDTTTNQAQTIKGREPFGVSCVGFVGPRLIVFGIGERGNTIGRPNTMFLYPLAQKKLQNFSFPVIHGVRLLAADPERRFAVWATDTKQLHVQDITRQATRHQILRNDCRALALSSDARWVAVASDWDILLYDITKWPAPPVTVGRHKAQVTSLAFSPDGLTLFSGSHDATVRAWEVERQLEKACFTWNIGRISALAIASDGLRAAAAGDSGNVAVWDLDE